MEKLGLYPLTVTLSFCTEKDAVSLLSAKRSFFFQVLPLFRKPKAPTYAVGDNDYGLADIRFQVSPVQDPSTLLDRLNSRRLRKRKRLGYTQNAGVERMGLSVSEIARNEWLRARTSYPAELELLRFCNEVLNQPEFRGLCGSPDPTTIFLVSYPRSGNTLARTLLERTTGLVTGSDTRPDRSLSKALAERYGLVGEGITAAKRVRWVKSHWPERVGHHVVHGHAAILLVRNPFDAIDSYWNMNATKSHTETLTEEMYNTYKEKWHGLVRNEIVVWNRFLDYWLGPEDECPIPMLVVRFEDLIHNPRMQLQRMMEFTMQQNQPMSKFSGLSVLSEYWLERIQHATASSTIDRLGSYQPRSAGGISIGKSLSHYTDELIAYIHETCASVCSENYLRRFGYDMFQQDFPNNFTNSSSSDRPPALNTTSVRRTTFTMFINQGTPVRSVSCPYGRLLQQWRYTVTDMDRVPLLTTKK
jgi:Sulfotransferase domain